MQLMRRHGAQRAHASVGVDSEDFKIDATIRFTALAGYAVATVEIRFDGATIAYLQSVRITAGINDLDA